MTTTGVRVYRKPRDRLPISQKGFYYPDGQNPYHSNLFQPITSMERSEQEEAAFKALRKAKEESD